MRSKRPFCERCYYFQYNRPRLIYVSRSKSTIIGDQFARYRKTNAEPPSASVQRNLFVSACAHPSRKPHPVSLSFPIIPDVFAHPGAFEPLDVKLPSAMSGFFHQAIAIGKPFDEFTPGNSWTSTSRRVLSPLISAGSRTQADNRTCNVSFSSLPALVQAKSMLEIHELRLIGRREPDPIS